MSIYDQKTMPSEVPEKDEGSNAITLGMSLGEYKIISELGAGGMGTVYKAYQESLERHVAIKVLKSRLSCDKNFISRFKIEARSAAKLQHPNIVQIYGIGETNSIHYFIMEFVEGKTLKDVIQTQQKSLRKSNRFLSIYDSLQIILQIAQGLQYAHQNGIIHGDIKPVNVIKDNKTERMMLGDFGLARPLDKDNIFHVKYSGTPCYMAPELFLGKKSTIKTDIYALGITFYEILAARPPFMVKNLKKLLEQIKESPYPDPRKTNPQVPKEISAVTIKCLEKSPEDRYPTVHDFIKDIFLFINEGRTHAFEIYSQLSKVKVKKEPKSRKGSLKDIILILIAGLILVGGSYFMMDKYLQKRTVRLKNDYCQRELQVVHNYLNMKRYDLARPVLENLCKKYPDSPYAKQAKQILKDLDDAKNKTDNSPH